MIQVGKYKIESIETASFALDGGAIFGIIPKTLWEKTNQADEKNRIPLTARCLLLQSDSKKILVETGIGREWDDKFKSIYKVDDTNDLIESLKIKGVFPEDITDVILTHLHFDHVGSAVTYENNKLVPAFPNAKYHVQKKQFEWAQNPSDKDRGSFIKEKFIPLAEEGVLQLWTDTQFDDEIEFIIVNGHTIAQQLVKFSDGNDTYLYAADLIPVYAQIQIPYIMGYDIQPLETVKEKKLILPKAVEENWKLIFEHDTSTAMATVKRTDKGFMVKERFQEL